MPRIGFKVLNTSEISPFLQCFSIMWLPILSSIKQRVIVVTIYSSLLELLPDQSTETSHFALG